MYKLAILPLFFAVASAGFIGAPVAYSSYASPVAYSAPAVATVSHSYSAPVAYSAPAVTYSAPVAYHAPAVVKTVAAPVATSYQNTYKVSKSALAVAPVATYAAAAPVVKTVSYAAPAVSYAAPAVSYAAPAYTTYAAHAPAVSYAAPAYTSYAAAAPAYTSYAAAAPAISYSAPLLKTASYGYAAPAYYH